MVYLDKEVVPETDFYLEGLWFWPRKPDLNQKPGVPEHVHDFDEVISFFGSNPDDLHDLGGEVELWIDGEKSVLNKSFMAYVPAGVKHCPITVKRVDRPFSTLPPGRGQCTYKSSMCERELKMPKTKYGNLIVTELKHPSSEPSWNPPVSEAGGGKGGRVFYLDSHLVPGAFYMETVWVFPRARLPPGNYETVKKRSPGPHSHDYDEIIAFFGSDTVIRMTLARRWNSGWAMRNISSPKRPGFHTGRSKARSAGIFRSNKAGISLHHRPR